MIEWFFWPLWGLWMVQALTSMVNASFFVRWMRREDEHWGKVKPDEQKAAVVIIPVKGFEPGETPQFFKSLFSQDYRRYRVIVAVESEEDPVVPWLRDQLGGGAAATRWEPGRPPGTTGGAAEVRLVIAGECRDCGQKVHNQIAAFSELEPEDEIVAFADSDLRMRADWLTKLTGPINAGTHPLATTYRWLIPERASLVNLLASVINASVATGGGNEKWNVLWGGSMAIARPDFDDIDVSRLFAGSLNDDLRLARRARRSGRRIAYVRSLLMPSPVDFTWRGFFEFGRRQYYQVRHFTPKLYRKVALALTSLYSLGFITAIVSVTAFGYWPAWIPIGIVFVCDQIRAIGRRHIYRTLFDRETVGMLSNTLLLEHLATPLWMTLHWMLVSFALFTREICWAGIRYRVLSRSETEVLGRDS